MGNRDRDQLNSNFKKASSITSYPTTSLPDCLRNKKNIDKNHMLCSDKLFDLESPLIAK